MRSLIYQRTTCNDWGGAVIKCMSLVLLTANLAAGSDDAVIAWIVDCRMPVSINSIRKTPAAVGSELFKDDTLVVSRTGSATLVFQDGAIKKFDGPAEITLRSSDKPSEGLLSKLASGLASVIFPGKKETEKLRLAVRGSISKETPSLTIPLLAYPPRGTLLMAAPDHLGWLPIEGATLYTAYLYDQNRRIWQQSTQNPGVALPLDSLNLQPGESYFWVVQTDIGNTSLRSEQSVFGLVDTLWRNRITQALDEINGSNLDGRLAAMLRINLYRNQNLLVEEYREVDAVLKLWPADYMVLLAKAELCEAMNLYQDAADCYHQALQH